MKLGKLTRAISKPFESVGQQANNHQVLQNPHQWTVDHQRELLGTANVVTGNAVGQSIDSAHMFDAGPGDKHDDVFHGADTYRDNRATQLETRRQQAGQARQDNLLNQNAENFGEGFSGNATQNAARINAARTSTANNTLKAGLTDADNSYQAGLTGNRVRQANSGTFGSGVDAQARNNLLSDYYSRIAGANASAANAGQAFDTNLQSKKNQLSGAIKGGQITDTTGMAYDAASLGNTNAYANAAGNSVGQIAGGVSSNLLSRSYNS